MPEWTIHLGHFLVRVFIRTLTILGTSLAGLILAFLSILIPALQGPLRHLSTWKQQVPKSAGRAFVLLLAGCVMVFFWSTITTVYDGQRSLASENKKLSQELNDRKKADAQLAIKLNNQYASTINLIQAFKELAAQSKRCVILVTAPLENQEVALIVANLAQPFCKVDAPFNPAAPDERVLAGAVHDAVIVHLARTDPDRQAFVVAMGNVFSVRRSYDVPRDLPNESVWIQIGPGFPWRKDPRRSGLLD